MVEGLLNKAHWSVGPLEDLLTAACCREVAAFTRRVRADFGKYAPGLSRGLALGAILRRTWSHPSNHWTGPAADNRPWSTRTHPGPLAGFAVGLRQ